LIRRDVGLQLVRQPHRLLAVGRLPNHLEVLLALQTFPRALPHEGVVIGDKDTDLLHLILSLRRLRNCLHLRRGRRPPS
jgi:hypothetical protein